MNSKDVRINGAADPWFMLEVSLSISAKDWIDQYYEAIAADYANAMEDAEEEE